MSKGREYPVVTFHSQQTYQSFVSAGSYLLNSFLQVNEKSFNLVIQVFHTIRTQIHTYTHTVENWPEAMLRLLVGTVNLLLKHCPSQITRIIKDLASKFYIMWKWKSHKILRNINRLEGRSKQVLQGRSKQVLQGRAVTFQKLTADGDKEKTARRGQRRR